MDIESAEYDIIDDILNSKIHIKQLLLEILEKYFDNGKAKTEILLKN